MVALARCLGPLAVLISTASAFRAIRKDKLQEEDGAEQAYRGRRGAGAQFARGELTNQKRNEEHKIRTDYEVTWEGWGVALAWWGNLFGDDAAVADLVWTLKEGIDVGPKPELQNLPGLGLNIARYNVGGSVGAQRDDRASDPPGRIEGENSTITMGTDNILDYKRTQGFWLNWFNRDPKSSSWNWDADTKQVAQLKMAKDRGADLFELFSNTPMWWMTKSKNPAGAVRKGDENLQEWNLQDHAYYMGQVAKHFKEEHDIKFHSISPYNEPSGNRWSQCFWHSSSGNNMQEGNCMYAAQQSRMVEAMHKELNDIGLADVLISASEENTFDQAGDTWREMDQEAMALVKQVNVHGYSGKIGNREHLAWRQWMEDKILWMSEYGDGDQWSFPNGWGGKANGMLMANVIHYDFEYLKMSSWSYWQILDETDGWGMIKFGNSDQEGKWGENKTHWHLEPKFWVLLHFTRHIRQGMYILKHNSFDNSGAYTIAAYSPGEKKLVLVTTNFNGDRWVDYDLSDFSKVVGSKGRSWVTDSDGDRKYQKEGSFGDWEISPEKKFGSQFTPWSVKTFEILDVEL